MRLINADAYMEKVRYEAKAMPQKQGETFVILSEWIMEKTPSIERNCGEWIYGEHDVAMCDGYRCDRCGFFVPWDYEHKFIDFINVYHYCPNCGARMLKGERVDD